MGSIFMANAFVGLVNEILFWVMHESRSRLQRMGKNISKDMSIFAMAGRSEPQSIQISSKCITFFFIIGNPKNCQYEKQWFRKAQGLHMWTAKNYNFTTHQSSGSIMQAYMYWLLKCVCLTGQWAKEATKRKKDKKLSFFVFVSWQTGV